MFYPHQYYVVCENTFSFLKDILPIIISSSALLISIVVPYLLIRYEKVYNFNKQNVDFLRQIEIYLLEWLNVTSNNTSINDEFLETINKPGGLFVKTFQFYDFPTIDFFKSYNVDLVNEFYIQTRSLKDFDHNLKTIDREYSIFKDRALNGSDKLPANGADFFKEALTNFGKHYPKIIKDVSELRIKVRLLLKEANNTNGLKINRFFSFSEQGRFWYKRDMSFTKEEIDAEKEVLEKEKK